MSDAQKPEEKKDIVWVNCQRKGCDNNQAERLPLPNQGQRPSAATIHRFKCTECGHVWRTPTGGIIVTDI